MARSPRPHVRVVSAEIEQEGRYLIAQRRPEARLPLLWEFPGGRVAPGETDAEALIRALLKRVGVHVDVQELSLHVSHAYDSYTLDLLVYKCRILEGEPHAKCVQQVRWVAPEDFGDYQFPGADQQTVEALLGDQAPTSA